MRPLLILLFTFLLSSCSQQPRALEGPFLTKDGITIHQDTLKPITGIVENFHENGQLIATSNAFVDKGRLAFQEQNFGEARKAWGLGSLAGDPEASFLLGSLLIDGYGLGVNESKAMDAFIKAYRGGHPFAAFSISHLLNLGVENRYPEIDLGVLESSLASSLPEIIVRAQAGDPTALYSLSRMYYQGLAAPVDIKESERLLSVAAGKHHCPAMATSLSGKYQREELPLDNLIEGLLSCAQMGYVDAQQWIFLTLLEALEKTGEAGLIKRAMPWIRKAAEQDALLAHIFLAEWFEDELQAESLPFALKAVSKIETHYGGEHPLLAALHDRIAILYLDAGNLRLAEKHLRYVVDLGTAEHWRTERAVVELGELLVKKKSHVEAERLLKDWLDRTNNVAEDYRVHMILFDIFRLTKRDDEALVLLDAVLASDSPPEDFAENQIGPRVELLTHMGRSLEAEEYLRTLIAESDSSSTLFLAILEVLNLYASLGRYDELISIGAAIIRSNQLGAGLSAHISLMVSHALEQQNRTSESEAFALNFQKTFHQNTDDLMPVAEAFDALGGDDMDLVDKAFRSLFGRFGPSATNEMTWPQLQEEAAALFDRDSQEYWTWVFDQVLIGPFDEMLNRKAYTEIEAMLSALKSAMDNDASIYRKHLSDYAYVAGFYYWTLDRFDEADLLLGSSAVQMLEYGPASRALLPILDLWKSVKEGSFHYLTLKWYEKFDFDDLDAAREVLTEAFYICRYMNKIMQNSTNTSVQTALSSIRNVQTDKRHYKNCTQTALTLLEKYHPNDPVLFDNAFQTIQRSRISAAQAATTQMASRFSADSKVLQKLIRESERIGEAYERVNSELLRKTGLATLPMPETNDVSVLETKLQNLRSESIQIDAQIRSLFPSYARIKPTAPLGIDGVQELLRSHEALLLLESFHDRLPATVLIVMKDQVHRHETDTSTGELKAMIAELRPGAFTPHTMEEIDNYDAALAHEIFHQVLAPANDLLAATSEIIFVPGEIFSGTPLSILVTEPPSTSPTPWLLRKHAVSVLPSVNSLRFLRDDARPSEARNRLIAFGDPLVGNPTPPTTKSSAVSFASIFRGSGIDLSELRTLPRLPETRDELLALAQLFPDGNNQIFTGANATEESVHKADLRSAKVIAFATHALQPGQVCCISEPGLVLTPPKNKATNDDGVLTASEISKLDLDAEWVILSACKTGVDNLGGLTTAFIYAGARQLLVSYWDVESAAATQLTTRMFSELRNSPGITGGEALRRSQLAFIDNNKGANREHPLIWAPFVVVGDANASTAKSTLSDHAGPKRNRINRAVTEHPDHG